MQKFHSFEKGQIIILLALVLVGLLGFTALAIDGGMIYADQRFSQSAADAASLASGGAAASIVNESTIWDCSTLGSAITAAYAEAIEQAAANDFTFAKDVHLGEPGHDHGVKVTCNQSDQYLDVQVMLSKVTPTSFVHLFTGEEMRSTVNSVVRVKPRILAGNGSAIVSLSKECQNNQQGVWFNGSSTTVSNGGIWSNSCLDDQHDSVTVNESLVYYHTGFKHDGFPDAIATSSYHPMTEDPLKDYPFVCGEPAHAPYDDPHDNPDKGDIYSPGKYDGNVFDGKMYLEPGLYCVSGTISMEGQDEVQGEGVTIYFTGGTIKLNGGSNQRLTAPNGYQPGEVIPGNAIEDLLLYAPNADDVTINGGSENYFGGTMYMPEAKVKINGNSSTQGWNTSIIGYGVDIVGNSNVKIIYNAEMDFGSPAYLQVQR